MANGAGDIADTDRFALRQAAIEMLKNLLRSIAGLVRTAQGQCVAIDDGLNAEPVFNDSKMGVVIAKQVAHEGDIVNIDDQGFAAPVCLRRL